MFGKKHNYWTTPWICGFLVLIFILQQTINGFTNLFILDTRIVFTNLWTPVSAIFLHSGLVHLLYNLFGLGLFGMILENIIGTKRFLRLFLIAGLVASLASIPFYTRVLGASGAIFGVMGCLAILRPKLTVWVHYLPMPMFIAIFVWGAGDILGIFTPGNTANIAHLAGMGYGILLGFTLRSQFKEKQDPRDKQKHTIHIDEQKVKEWEKQF